MVGLVVTPSLEQSLIQRRGIVTVPDEDAKVSCKCVRGEPCHGIEVSKIPLEARTLENHMRMMGDRFISRMRARGVELVGGDLKMHGPWPSYQFNKTLQDVESSLWNQALREDDLTPVLPMVMEQPTENGYSDYLLVGDFMARNVWIEVEVPDADES